MSESILNEFRQARCRVDSLTAEAFWHLKGLGVDSKLFSELLQVEHSLRLEQFSSTGDMDATVTRSTVGNANNVRLAVGPSLPERFGRYVVKGAISQGAFGSVYQAEDPTLGREVAIKSPRDDRALDEAARAEFEREARLICRLEHPHILPVYDFGFSDNGRPYLVCKLVMARSLAERIESRGLNFHETTRVVAQMARALHHSHQHGVVHRDVKPANILLEESGHAWLADFGLGLESPKTDLSQDRSGTPRYWSPEQAEANSHLVDGRSDIFSLGVILYESLTGVHPFDGTSIAALLKRLLEADVRPPRQLNDRVPRKLEEACMRALRRNPLERYSTAADFAEDLEEAATYQPQPIDTSKVELSPALESLLERLSENTHEIWSQCRIAEGWIVGSTRDDKKKTHPDLVPYEQLSEGEKDYDRAVVRAVFKAAIALGSKITPPPNKQID
ncbi:MAG: protein kinase [Pirellulaceae bacterium]|nr:protein kinase [Pirellulaceae bacterium]